MANSPSLVTGAPGPGVFQAAKSALAWLERNPLPTCAALFAIGVLAAAARLLVHTPVDIVWGDELFYFFQARKLVDGELVWFENTVPFMSPLMLAPFSFSLLALRLWVAVLMSGASVMFFSLVRRRISFKVAILAWALWTAHSHALYGIMLYSETVFLLLGFGYLLLADRWLHKPRMVPVLGMLLGACMLARPFGIFWGVALGVERLLVRGWGTLRERETWHLVAQGALACAIYLAWLLRGGWSFVDMMLSTPDGIPFPEPYIRVPGEVFSYVVFMAALAGLCWGPTRGRRFALGWIAAILFTFANAVLISQTFCRHFVVLVPIAIVFAAGFVVTLPRLLPRRLVPVALGALLLLFAVEQWHGPLPGLMNRSLTNHFYVDSADCHRVERLLMSCAHENRPRYVQVPYLDQPPFTTCNYTSTEVLSQDINWLYSSYTDDESQLHVDGELVGRASFWDAALFPAQLTSGSHQLSIATSNGYGFGGIGQLLLCPEKLEWMPDPS